MLHSLAHAFGIGRPAERQHFRPGDRRIVGRWIRAIPWNHRFRFGWILSIDGPYWHTGVGIVDRDWNGGNWLGGLSWRRYGPIAFCRNRRRGSWRSDRRFARVMAKPTITAEALKAHESLVSDLHHWARPVHELVVERIEALQNVHPKDHPGGETAREWAERVLAKGQYPLPPDALDRNGYEYVQATYGTVTYSGPYPQWSADGEDYQARIAYISVPSWVITDTDGPDRYRAETTAMVAAATAERDAQKARLDEIIKKMFHGASQEED